MESDKSKEKETQKVKKFKNVTIAPFDSDGEPFDGVFYSEGDDEPLIVDPKTMTMGDLVRLVNEAVDKNQMVEELLEWIATRTQGDVDLATTLMKKGLRRLSNKNKLKNPCPIIVKEKGIFVELPDQKLKKVTFGRGNLAKTLYIFFLRQIVRAEKDNAIPICLSQFELEDHKEELLDIYENISGKTGNIEEIESWLEKGTVSNTFSNALASIRKFFDKLFNNYVINYKWKKCYSIEIMGEDRYGNPRYGIGLDIDDFDLGWYSIDRTRF